jgi:hypothetical protein
VLAVDGVAAAVVVVIVDFIAIFVSTEEETQSPLSQSL